MKPDTMFEGKKGRVIIITITTMYGWCEDPNPGETGVDLPASNKPHMSENQHYGTDSAGSV